MSKLRDGPRFEELTRDIGNNIVSSGLCKRQALTLRNVARD